jgi:exosome complex component CSL4
MVSVKTGDFVLIGVELCNTEEFLGDADSTFNENGKIIAAIPGYVQIDPKMRSIKIDAKQDNKRKLPRKGDMVIATIDVIRAYSAGCTIYKINNKLNESGVPCNIHVSSMARRFVDKIEDAFQKTDIVRAQVIGFDGMEWKLSTTGMTSGVVYAQCKYCGTAMTRKNRDQITCNFCGNTERRILAPDFGMVNEEIDF